MSQKTLSVIMANYNYGHYIGRALEAILTQSFVPKEVVVADDGSTDNSVDVIKGFMRKYPNLRLIKNEKNIGVMLSTERMMEEVSGDYLYACASDDWVLPGFFEKSMNLLLKYPQAGLCCADNLVYDGESYIENRAYLSDKTAYLPPNEVLKHFKKEAFTPFVPHTVILKREALISAGGYRTELEWSADSFVYSVISFRFGMCYVPEILTVMRVHKYQYAANMAKRYNLERRVIRKLIETAKSTDYKDVSGMFRQTAPFSTYPWEVLNVVINNRKYWDFLSLKLIRFALFDKLIRRFLMKLLPVSFWRKVLRNIKLMKYAILHLMKING
jgi:glycosyltransferase involved in cell wall biosynthesis